MYRFELTYEHFGTSIQKTGEVLERTDAYELLFKLLEREGKPVALLVRNSGGDMGYQESLERTRHKDVRVNWL